MAAGDISVPHVSVIIPARNAAATLDRTLESLVPDRERIREILLVDDDSDDGTGEVAGAAARRLELPLRHLHRTAGGAGAARNIGLAEATGDHVYFLDADDEVVAGGLTCLAQALRADPAADLAIGTAIRRTAGRPDKPKVPHGYGPDPAANADNYFRNKLWPIAIGSALARRDPAAGIRFPETISIDEDTWYWAALILSARVVTVPEPVLYYNLDEERVARRLSRAPRRQFVRIAAAFNRLADLGLAPAAIRWRKSWIAMRLARQQLIDGDYDMARSLMRPVLANGAYRADVPLRVTRYVLRVHAGLLRDRLSIDRIRIGGSE